MSRRESHTKYMRKWRVANREKVRGYDRAWRAKSKDHLRAYNKRKRAAQREQLRKWRAKNRARVAILNRSWRVRNPVKREAHMKVRRAIEHGKLVRSIFCVLCLGVGRIDAHHPDYTKPLEVIWLCRPCHRSVDRIFGGKTQ